MGVTQHNKMFKWIITIIIIVILIAGGVYLFNGINTGSNQNNGNNSNLDNAPSTEFTDLTNSDSVFNEIDNAIASLDQ